MKQTTLFDRKNMQLIAKSQLVGTSPGMGCFRDLFEDSNGNRLSIKTSHDFSPEDERNHHKKDGKEFPTQEELFDKYKKCSLTE